MFNKNKGKKYYWSGLLIGIIAFISISYNSMAYVMPAEQLLGFMTDNFSGYRSVVLIQSVLRTTPENEKVFTEQLSLSSPDKYSTKLLDRLGGRNDSPDLTYRQLLMANKPPKLEHVLGAIGIDLKTVSYTRIDGEIAYRIGSGDPESPKLLIEKERFVPLLLIYKVPGEFNEKMVTVRFQEYQQEGKGWYPFEIIYSEGSNLVERYTVQTFQFNVPVDSTILQRFPELEIPEEIIDDEEIDHEEDQLIAKDLLRKITEVPEEQYEQLLFINEP
ncbi:hypothetical protein ACFL6W_01305 [Thermodesulfobacteriota bacterium]